MRRTLAIGLAAVLVATTATATSGTALARNNQNQWKPGPPQTQHRHNPPRYHSPGVAGPFLFGTFLGLALAPAFYPPAPPPPPPVTYPRATSTHIAICQQWYGVWYNPATDLWTDSLGGIHRCTAPY
jgi:hypothetical protein